MASGVQRQLTATVLLAVAACGDGQPAPAPSLSPTAHVASVLEHCHGPLRGTLDRVVLELRPANDTPPLQITAMLPERLRVARGEGAVELLTADGAWTWQPDQPAVELTGDRLTALRQLRDCVGALLLLPLYGARDVERRDSTLQWASGDGDWQLDLDDDGRRPRRLRGPTGVDIRFLTYLDTGFTRLPRQTDLGALGSFEVALIDAELLVADDVFRPPATHVTSEPPPTALRVSGPATELPANPELQDLPARRFLVLEDPGDWEGRRDLLEREAQGLADRGQTAAGLPVYCRTDDKARVLIPFRSKDPQAPPLVPASHEMITDHAEMRAIVVAPAPGPWDQTVQRAGEQLDRFLTAHALRATGPLWITPIPSRGVVPATAELERLRLRFELPVAQR